VPVADGRPTGTGTGTGTGSVGFRPGR
jgi:hypothetical protein